MGSLSILAEVISSVGSATAMCSGIGKWESMGRDKGSLWVGKGLISYVFTVTMPTLQNLRE